ncbi:hypothetical protein [Streptomyces sp. NPDC019937]|uniref:hypothetical protein n=1 Tax=Streptomyces sp. NPDC019937 TaxID=3154787 RepID=UPI0033CDFFD3
MVTATAYLYPWDVVGDPAAPERIAALGVDAVALAAAYHSVRAATPFHPAHRVVEAHHAALYLPVRGEAWAGSRLAPATPPWMPTPDSFREARDALRAVGLPVHAWTVLTHNTRLGRAHPDLAVRNAFGDPYPYALCPSSAEVRAYCTTLVREVLTVGEPDGLVLEACGPLGLGHGGHHEKTEGADWDASVDRLLSWCFCGSCLARYEAAGLDPRHLRHQVMDAVDGSAPLSPALLSTLREIRTTLTADLRREVLAAASGPLPLTLHASADPWATGPFATIADAPALPVTTLVASAWTSAGQGAANLTALRPLAAPDTRLAAYVPALPPRPADPSALAAEWTTCLAAGADELHLYHAGLASPARLSAIRTAIRTALRAVLGTAPGTALGAVRTGPEV